jgi:hypothetical protein
VTHLLMDDELCECLQYDLKAELRVDLKGLFSGQFTLRDLVVWVKHLPSDSALGRRGIGEHKPALTDRLFASSINEQRLMRWTYISARSNERVEQPDLVDLDATD